MTKEPLRRLYGYARVSTDDQDLSLQRAALIRHGVDPDWIYEEHASGGSMKRKQLSYLLRSIRPHDTLVVWKLDRLGRTLRGVLDVLEQIESDGINFVSITESFDTSTPMGKAMLQMALVFAELERSMISERTKAGLMEARKRGKKFGQPNKILDFPKRIGLLRRLERGGKLRDEDGDLAIKAEDLRVRLNNADKNAQPITSAETVRRWARKGFPGLAVSAVDDDQLEGE
jgi:DNA invertase Pin-like site-specific DNA recombinase